MDILSVLVNAGSYLLNPITIAFALAATGLSVHFGYAGLLNFGMAAFVAIGGYGYAISVLTFDLPWYLAMLVALIASAVFALILGIPTLRLRADYLAIVTIAASEIVRYLLLTTVFDDVTGSSAGLSGYHDSFRAANPIPEGTYPIGPWKYTADQLWAILFGLILLAIAIFVVWALMRSPWGRVLKGIREDEDAVRSLGKNVFAYKMQALVLGGIIGGMGGIVLVLGSAVVPGQYATSMTFTLWTIMLLGGASTVFGPAIGSVLYWVLFSFITSLLSMLAKANLLPFTDTQASTIVPMLVGVSLMLIVIFRPQGLFGNKREMTFVK